MARLHNPGFHTSDTIDLVYVAEGELTLDLDDGNTPRCRPATPSSETAPARPWRNPGDVPAIMIVTSLGIAR